MTVYIEDTIIENFVITYLLINMVYDFLKVSKSKKRILFSSIFGAFISLLYPLIKLNGILNLIMKFGVAYIISLIAYKTNSQKKQLLFFMLFLLLTAVYGGINLMVYFSIYGDFESKQKLPSLIILLFTCIITYFINQIKKAIYKKRVVNNFTYNIRIFNDNVKVDTKGYLDTGNILCDPVSNSPVILINYKIFNILNKNFPIQNIYLKKTEGLKNGHLIEVKTATAKDSLLAFKVDLLEIDFNNKKKIIKNPTFALSKIKLTGFDCDVVLNSKLLIGDKNVF